MKHVNITLQSIIVCGLALPVWAGNEDTNCDFDHHQLTVWRHPNRAFTNADADGRFMGASNVIMDNCVAGDVACCVDMTRSGSVSVFPAPFNGAQFNDITVEADLNNLLNNTPDCHFKVVNSMTDACNAMGMILGCALPGPGVRSVVIVPQADPDVWAHEFGHNQGLPHRDDDDRNIMHSTAANTCKPNQTECDAFHLAPSKTDEGACACGNGIRDCDEECDGTDDAGCPGMCRPDCTCPPTDNPALPGWSGIALAALLFVAGVFVFGKGRREATLDASA